jgi:hypothetical protein
MIQKYASRGHLFKKYHILLSIVQSCRLFYIENDTEIFPAHYTWKVDEKGFKIAFMMIKLAVIISFEIILEK